MYSRPAPVICYFRATPLHATWGRTIVLQFCSFSSGLWADCRASGRVSQHCRRSSPNPPLYSRQKKERNETNGRQVHRCIISLWVEGTSVCSELTLLFAQTLMRELCIKQASLMATLSPYTNLSLWVGERETVRVCFTLHRKDKQMPRWHWHCRHSWHLFMKNSTCQNSFSKEANGYVDMLCLCMVVCWKHVPIQRLFLKTSLSVAVMHI